MEIVTGVVFVLIMIIIGMIFGRSVQLIEIICKAVVKFFKKLY